MSSDCKTIRILEQFKSNLKNEPPTSSSRLSVECRSLSHVSPRVLLKKSTASARYSRLEQDVGNAEVRDLQIRRFHCAHDLVHACRLAIWHATWVQAEQCADAKRDTSSSHGETPRKTRSYPENVGQWARAVPSHTLRSYRWESCPDRQRTG